MPSTNPPAVPQSMRVRFKTPRRKEEDTLERARISFPHFSPSSTVRRRHHPTPAKAHAPPSCGCCALRGKTGASKRLIQRASERTLTRVTPTPIWRWRQGLAGVCSKGLALPASRPRAEPRGALERARSASPDRVHFLPRPAHRLQDQRAHTLLTYCCFDWHRAIQLLSITRPRRELRDRCIDPALRPAFATD